MKTNTVYEIVTARILESLEKGVAPWRKTWKEKGTNVTLNGKRVDFPINAQTRRPYRGINVLVLSLTMDAGGYSDPRFLTFNQAKALGGKVKKGERGTPVVFWKWVEKTTATEEESGEETPTASRKVPILRYYTVFNVQQTEGCKLPEMDVEETAETPEAVQFEAVQAAESILANSGGIQADRVEHGGNRACYSPFLDLIKLPEPVQFESPAAYYTTRFHEEIHATGHPSRLNRKGIADFNGFGTETYSREELVAEMGAAFLAGIAGLDMDLDNSAAYVAGWAKFLSDKPKEVVFAAGQAHKAVDLILGSQEDEAEDED